MLLPGKERHGSEVLAVEPEKIKGVKFGNDRKLCARFLGRPSHLYGQCNRALLAILFDRKLFWRARPSAIGP
jgi:hypothetical protein